eukprot:FR737148.1.p1 GENE.FR737148.1~~FR737148.1.p1  ORF type:complete len:127 (-),score=6.04 FR737148.1:162-542(-)
MDEWVVCGWAQYMKTGLATVMTLSSASRDFRTTFPNPKIPLIAPPSKNRSLSTFATRVARRTFSASSGISLNDLPASLASSALREDASVPTKLDASKARFHPHGEPNDGISATNGSTCSNVVASVL